MMLPTRRDGVKRCHAFGKMVTCVPDCLGSSWKNVSGHSVTLAAEQPMHASVRLTSIPRHALHGCS